MSDLRAVDIPELRHKILRATTSAAGARFFALMARDGCFDGPRIIAPSPGEEATPGDVGRRYHAAEIEKLSAADLYYVTSDMTNLARVAARSLPEFSLRHEDLPSPRGFIYFDRPLRVTDGTSYYAASWGPTGSLGPNLDGWGIAVMWYGDGHDSQQTGMTLPLGVDHWPFCAELSAAAMIGNDINFAQTIDETVDPLKHDTLRAAFLLMQQELTNVETEALDRHTRKRLVRAGVDDLTAPRVVSIRRRSHGGNDGESSRNFHHQWVVNGHWRRQWYATQDRHKPVWIAPHMKGPEGAPILGGDKVYAWRR